MVGDHMDRAGPDFGRQTGEVLQRLRYQENARPTAARTIYINSESNKSLQFKRKTREGLADTSRASPLECLRSGLGLIADPIMTAQH